MPSLALLTLLSSGCGIYLHDAKNQAKSEAALKDFQTFRDKSGNPYSVMLKNLEKAKAATADAQRAAAERRVSGYALGLPYKKWEDLNVDLGAQKTELEATEADVSAAIDALADELKAAGAAKADAKTKLDAVKKAVTEQFNRNQRWLGQQALFKHAIQKIAQLSTDKQSDLTLSALEQAGAGLLDVEISVPQQDAAGDVTVANKKIRDVIGVDLPKNPKSFSDLVKGLANIKLETDSPGIALTILGLAVDLADAEYRKAQAGITNMKRRAELLDALERNIDESNSAVSVAAGDVSAFPQKDLVLDYLESQRAKKSASGVGAGLRALARAAIPSTTLASERLRLQVELATLEHEYSIRISAINAQAHEALIGRGLEGLAAYHRGGITPEEIANFIRAAQTVALGVIGGRL